MVQMHMMCRRSWPCTCNAIEPAHSEHVLLPDQPARPCSHTTTTGTTLALASTLAPRPYSSARLLLPLPAGGTHVRQASRPSSPGSHAGQAHAGHRKAQARPRQDLLLPQPSAQRPHLPQLLATTLA